MKPSISRRIVKPVNCLLAFGIPGSRESFMMALENPANRDFVVNCCPVWEKYNYEIVSEIDFIEPVIKTLGVRVIHDLRLEDFGQLFKQESVDVIVLFCHWKDEAVEFADGLADVATVVDQIPPGYSGLLDLCVCHPRSLAVAVRNSRPACLTKFTDKIATPEYWLYFYWALFKMLDDADLTYLSALEATVDTFLY